MRQMESWRGNSTPGYSLVTVPCPSMNCLGESLSRNVNTFKFVARHKHGKDVASSHRNAVVVPIFNVVDFSFEVARRGKIFKFTLYSLFNLKIF